MIPLILSSILQIHYRVQTRPATRVKIAPNKINSSVGFYEHILFSEHKIKASQDEYKVKDNPILQHIQLSSVLIKYSRFPK